MRGYTLRILTLTTVSRTRIESLGVHLPEREVRTQDILDGCRRHIFVPLERWSGISSRRTAGGSEFSIDLAERAIAKCLAASEHGAGDIDLLICCNISKVDAEDIATLEPSTAHGLLERFDFGNIAHFDLGNACAGLFTGIMVADRMLQQHVVSRVLVVSGEYITHLTKTAQRELEGSRDRRLACLTLGDAAAALILERTDEPGMGFTSLELRSAPEHSDLCVAYASDENAGGAIMFTDTVGLADAGTDNAVLHIKEIVDRDGYAWDYPNHWIIHQTSSRALRAGAAQMNRLAGTKVVTPENSIDNLRNRGNTATTSHWVALNDSIESGRINDGETVAFSIAASGVTVGVAFYELGDLPQRLRAASAGSNGVLAAVAGTNGANGSSATIGSNGRGLTSSPEPATVPPKGPLFHKLPQRIRVEQIGLTQPVAKPTDDEVGSAVQAAWACLAKSEYGAADIDLLIFTGTYRRKFLSEPALATMVANKLGIIGSLEDGVPSRFLAFDILNGSLGLLTAAWVASNLISCGEARVAMIVNAECVQHQRRNSTLGIVDAASALILDTGDGDTGFESFSFQSQPGGYDGYATYANWVGGPAKLTIEGDPALDRRAALPLLAETFAAHLGAMEIEKSELAALIGPQASAPYATELAAATDLPTDRVVDAGYGALFTSGFAFGLQQLRSQGIAGEPVAVLDYAPGMQAGCAIYRQ